MKSISLIILAFMLCFNVSAEDTGKGGDEFRKTASEFEELAKKYSDKGNDKVAALYQRMAEIKLNAAEKGDMGEWDSIDWTEYEEISAKVEKMKPKKGYSK